ncbi:MAG TPA: hypothetical protein DIU35_02600 [Candidatus Latescibacteria bacterium]|nr:hypothetical protein [Candidatus Latescibacterota bacterium]
MFLPSVASTIASARTLHSSTVTVPRTMGYDLEIAQGNLQEGKMYLNGVLTLWTKRKDFRFRNLVADLRQVDDRAGGCYRTSQP